MHSGRHRSCAALLCAALAGCAGSGEGLDQNGQPLSGSPGSSSLTADFESIQENIFTPICSKCHIGASAPEGLQLDADHSYDMLIGVSSAEEPSLLRIKPGDPDDSYLVRKIEGAAGIDGGQMPLGETPLPQAAIDAIRQWVTNGAPEGSTAAVAQSVFELQSTSPQNREIATSPVARIMVAFTQSVDASLVNDTTFILERMTPGRDPQRIAVAAARIEENPRVVLLTPRRALTRGAYRVTIRGSGAAALADSNAATLGSDVSIEFGVEETR